MDPSWSPAVATASKRSRREGSKTRLKRPDAWTGCQRLPSRRQGTEEVALVATALTHRFLHKRGDLFFFGVSQVLSAKSVGHMAPLSKFASSLKPSFAYLDLNFSALLKKQTTLPSLACAGILQAPNG
jgi:hypothetical protein